MSQDYAFSGLASLAIVESLIISLTERSVISRLEAANLMSDAIAALRAESAADGAGEACAEAIAIIEKIKRGANGVRSDTPIGD